MYSFPFWFQLGCISFGGPAGQIALMHRYVVVEKKWISEQRFLNALQYCMLLPGPEAQQLATYLGFMMHGYWGGIVAGVLFVLPSMLVLLLLSYCYVTYSHLPILQAILYGVQTAIVAIVVLAVIKIAQKSLRKPPHYFVALLALLASIVHFPFPLVIIFSVLLAVIVSKIKPAYRHNNPQNSIQQDDESAYLIQSGTRLTHLDFSWSKLLVLFLISILLWCLPPFLLSYTRFAADDNAMNFWDTIRWFFSKAALVTFGGAYAVLPYVAQISVEQFHWLSPKQMLDGLALGESTPGPLIMVLAFVGFMAAYNTFDHDLIMASITLVLTTYYTFLPSFFFIFAGAPLIEYTHREQQLQQYLSFVTPAVVGLMSYLVLYLALHTYWNAASSIDYLSLLWGIMTLIALHWYKMNLITCLLISCLFGISVKILLPLIV